MSEFEDYYPSDWTDARPPDPAQERARAKVEKFFEGHREEVFFSRQIEVFNEDEFFHWISNRAIRDLEQSGLVRSESRELKSGGNIKLLWHVSYRYYRRAAAEVVKLVEEYADPNIGAALGMQGELLVLEGFAKREFVLKGRNTREFAGKKWIKTEHDLDFIFERDARAYGVEVKNTLGYMEHYELEAKIAMCQALGVAPVFVARMMPRVWINELFNAGGFALILKWQLYPVAQRELARRVAQVLKLPVDAPRALAEGTMARVMDWHNRRL